MKTVILLDGDIYAYKHASGCEVATDWGDDMWTLHTDTKQAIAQMDQDIKAVVLALKADAVEVALSGRENFRRRVDETYKAGRKKSRKPIGLPSLREHLMHEWRGKVIQELEADDLLGIWATDPMFRVGDRKIIVSTDKDMRTIPCELWNPNHPEFGVKNISRKEADVFHLYQTLCGDSTDGYAGCPTIGHARATRILEADPTWAAVVKAFETQGLTESDALVQGRLARILRVENYNVKKEKLKHWIP